WRFKTIKPVIACLFNVFAALQPAIGVGVFIVTWTLVSWGLESPTQEHPVSTGMLNKYTN
ncbi:MAG TPA: hypothetical protein DD611_00160, partial [Alphaproteobacteria bacterium]|nr:hypothetical protein [Alphaproteobacteria bacterium]